MATNNQPSQLEGKISTVSFFRLFLRFVKYWTLERVIGVSLLFYAFITAIIPHHTTIDLLAQTLTGKLSTPEVNVLVISSWFLLSGIYLLAKGKDIGFSAFLLCLFPLSIQIISDILYGVKILDGGYIAREVIILGFITQRIITRLALDILENVGISNTNIE